MEPGWRSRGFGGWVCKQERGLEQSRGGHACEHESSLMLYIDESLCHMEHAVEEYREQLPGTVKNRAERVYLANRMETEHGVNGNATLATKEKGEKILHAMVDDIVRFLESFQKLVVRAG